MLPYISLYQQNPSSCGLAPSLGTGKCPKITCQHFSHLPSKVMVDGLQVPLCARRHASRSSKQTPTLVDMKSGRNKVWRRSDGKGGREREGERMRSWLEIIICRRPSWPRGSKERDAKLPAFQPHHDGRPEKAGVPIL